MLEFPCTWKEGPEFTTGKGNFVFGDKGF